MKTPEEWAVAFSNYMAPDQADKDTWLLECIQMIQADALRTAVQIVTEEPVQGSVTAQVVHGLQHVLTKANELAPLPAPKVLRGVPEPGVAWSNGWGADSAGNRYKADGDTALCLLADGRLGKGWGVDDAYRNAHAA